MPNANDLQTALRDLVIAIRLSCVNDDGTINAYEKNGTAKIIVLAVTALAKSRESEGKNADRIHIMSDEELAEACWLEWLKKKADE